MACKYKGKVWENGWCNVACSYCTATQEVACEYNRQTNGDRVRSMSNEKLANVLGDKYVCPPSGNCAETFGNCDSCWLKWLEKPVEDE